jgi:3(or 17)beta-hydroxysteroid dehydrogenase
MNRLDGKVALISGAARGIGAETARLMAEAGAKVAVGDVLDERGRETARAIESTGAEAIYTRLDVTREEDWTARSRPSPTVSAASTSSSTTPASFSG